MASINGTAKNAILSQFVTLCKEVSDFENRVFKGMYAGLTDRTLCFIHLNEDDSPPEESTTTEDEHYLTINILVKLRSDLASNDPEERMEQHIELVGLVEDKLNANRGTTTYWEALHITNINYGFGHERQFNYHQALMTVIVRHEW
jgi:hypothetical protein